LRRLPHWIHVMGYGYLMQLPVDVARAMGGSLTSIVGPDIPLFSSYHNVSDMHQQRMGMGYD